MNWCSLFSTAHLEIDIATARDCTTWSDDAQNRFIVLIFDSIWWYAKRPLFFNAADDLARWRRDFKSLQAAWKATTQRWTSIWAIEVDHFARAVIEHLHIEWTGWTATVSSTAIIVLSCPVHLVQGISEDFYDFKEF